MVCMYVQDGVGIHTLLAGQKGCADIVNVSSVLLKGTICLYSVKSAVALMQCCVFVVT